MMAMCIEFELRKIDKCLPDVDRCLPFTIKFAMTYSKVFDTIEANGRVQHVRNNTILCQQQIEVDITVREK